MADVFISHCMQDAELAQELATGLDAWGYAEWRDPAYKAAGGGVNVGMSRVFGAAKAVIVVWSPDSINLEPVLAAAQSALSGRKLIGVCLSSFDAQNVPAEFRNQTVGSIANRAAIYAALETLGVKVRRGASASITEDADELVHRGDDFRFGRAGCRQNYAKAVRLYRRAAELNHPKAAYHLGVLYENGRGVARDEAEAVRFYRQAAALEHSDACFQLGVRYVYGNGVEQDYAEAVRLYRLAAQMNHVTAINNLGDMYENGFGVEKDEAEAVRLYRQAAGMGGGSGALSLGACYEKGIGVDKDLEEARRWYLRAIELGDEEAEEWLDNLELGIDEAEEGLGTGPSPAGSPAMPEELRDLIQKAKAEVAEDENHELSFGTRKALLRALGPVLMEADGRSTIPGPGQIRRTHLCIAIVRPFLPLWDEYYAPNRDPKLMLVLAKRYLAGMCPKERLERKAYAFSGGLENSGPPEEDLAWLTGHASVCAAYVAIHDEILTADQGISEDDLLDPQDPDLWDCAFWTAAAAAGGMPWVEGFDKEKYAAFWNHYLDVAIPNAWVSVSG
jgi:TPR repeat protein